MPSRKPRNYEITLGDTGNKEHTIKHCAGNKQCIGLE